MSQPIVVPFDFSRFSESAFGEAWRLAFQLKIPLHLIHVVGGDKDSDSFRHASQKLLQVPLPSQELQVEIRREVLTGSVVDSLLQYAIRCEARLIVIGTHARTGLAHWTFGSVAERVMRGAPCPTMVVHSDVPNGDVHENEADLHYRGLQNSESPALDLIARGVSLRASDIHLDPISNGRYQIRLRVDGRVVPFTTLDQQVADQLLRQFATLAKIDHADPFRPHEGRIPMAPPMSEVEVRITMAPVACGTAIALRIISKEHIFRPLTRLGLSDGDLSKLRSILEANEGLFLVTGPTGSGKTTTVYSMLESLQSRNPNIVSVEDPVEFAVPFVRQLNVDDRHGVTMASGLRTILRMDPDIVFIGEIRDPEAAEIALQAARSGRLVFSSLHTRDVASTITALRDLGISDRSISGNLSGIINQRLVRRLCLDCRKASIPSPEVLASFHEMGLEPPIEVYEPVGCERCQRTGFLERIGLFETLVCKGAIADAIEAGATENTLRTKIRELGIPSLAKNGLIFVRDGLTSYEEISRARWL